MASLNLVSGLLDAQYRIAVLEKIVDVLVRRNPGTIQEAEVKQFREEALAELRKRFPEAGIFLQP